MSWNLVHMKDIPPPHLLLKFQPKICESLVTRTCPKFLCCQKTHTSPLGVKGLKEIQFWGQLVFLCVFDIQGAWLDIWLVVTKDYILTKLDPMTHDNSNYIIIAQPTCLRSCKMTTYSTCIVPYLNMLRFRYENDI